MATVKQKRAAKALTVKSLPTDTHWRWHYIYIIKCDEYYKIGIAWSLDNRLNSLQCGNPYELELLWAKKVDNAKAVETIIHEKYKDKRHFREWFILDEAQVEEIKNMVDSGGI